MGPSTTPAVVGGEGHPSFGRVATIRSRRAAPLDCRRDSPWQAVRLATCRFSPNPSTHFAATRRRSRRFDGKAILAVNVASKCGLTPQYTGLEALQEKYSDKGFHGRRLSVQPVRWPGAGTAEEIETFCSTTYGVTFPMMEKIDVNGEDRHPIYAELTRSADAEGHSGDIRWNFEKFLIAPDGAVTRFSPMVTPEDPALVEAIEASLPG